MTYAEIGALAHRQAAKLDELGIGVGERVAVVSHNSARLLTSFFGVCGSGRVLVPVNFRLRPDEVAYIVEHSGARVLLVDPELDESLREVNAEHRFVLGDDEDLYAAAGVEPQAWEPDESATACINYTSGTTARPKGVQITHRNIWVNAVTFALHAGVTDRDVYLHTLPMFHANGWGMPFAMTGLGRAAGRDPQDRRRRDPAPGRAPRRDRPVRGTRRRVGSARSSPGLGRRDPGPGPGPDHRRGGAAADQDRGPGREELGWEFIQIYGLTETSPLADGQSHPRGVGRPLGRGTRREADPRRGAGARRTPLALGPEGEVLARSNVVLEGYWEQPEETARALAGGWFHTGDGGVIGDDGYLTISDRKKDVIITGGENVSSIEVEDVLFSHPAVAEVAVIGVPSEKWGETITGPGRAGRGRAGHRGGADRVVQGQGGRLQGADARSSSATSSRAPPPASCRSSSCGRRTGRGWTARSTERSAGPLT